MVVTQIASPLRNLPLSGSSTVVRPSFALLPEDLLREMRVRGKVERRARRPRGCKPEGSADRRSSCRRRCSS